MQITNKDSFTLIELLAPVRKSFQFFVRGKSSKDSFTLIELLVVIAILAILSVAVVFIINPADIIKQSRDTNRLTDLNNLNKALAVFDVTNPDDFVGTSTVVYVSLPDSTTTCANLGLPTLPSGYTYQCVTSSTLTQADGTGWIPVNFTNVSYGSPVQRLPIDPVNTSSTGQYYTYIMGGSWALSARAESAKYSPKAFNDNGYDPDRMEVGSNLVLYQPATTLLAHYFAQPGSGTTAIDYSGNSRSGVITAGAGGWTTDNKGNTTRAYDFDGATTKIDISSPPQLTSGGLTISAWIRGDSLTSSQIIAKGGQSNNFYDFRFGFTASTARLFFAAEKLSVGQSFTARFKSSVNFNDGIWYHVAATWDGASSYVLYQNGLNMGSLSTTAGTSTAVEALNIGNVYDGFGQFDGRISDLRVYNRVLSAAEISAIHNSTR